MYNQGFSVEEAVKSVVRKVYGWMATALAVTAGIAYYVGNTPAIYTMIFKTPGLILVLFIAQFGLVMALSAGIKRLSFGAAFGLFYLFAVLTGLFFSSIFIRFTLGSIFSTFLVTAGMFGMMSIYGYFTNADLSKMGSFLFMALIGLIIAGLVNIFVDSAALQLGYSFFGVIIFSLFTAYDIQKVKMLARSMVTSGEDLNKVSVLAALTFYLDFINLFSFILNFMGNKKD